MLNKELLRQAGLAEEVIAKLIQSEKTEVFNTKVKALFTNAKVKAVEALLKTFDIPLKLTISIDGGGESTIKIARASTNPGNSNGNGGAKMPCQVNGIKYKSCAAACRAQGLEIGRDSPKRVLQRALANKAIESFQLV